MGKIKVIINKIQMDAEEGETIMVVAKRNGIEIPNLCLNERLENIGACRLCVVDIVGMQKLQAACSTNLKDGMVINTYSPRVLEARRINIELLLANHDLNCVTCKKNLNCKLQRYSEELMVQTIRYSGEKRCEEPDNSSVSIKRDNNKCILCEQCFRICNDIQTVYAIGQQHRGFKTLIAPPFKLNMAESSCVNCGQCLIACPTAALSERTDIDKVIKELNSDKYLIAQVAPSIRATLGECFGMQPGERVTGKIVTGLKQIGFHDVFDTDFAADLTIIEEATEFVKRFKEKRDLPMITTCCPAWIKFGEQFFYNELHHMSSCRSPQAILASLIKTYYAEKINKDPKDIILIDIMPCTAKKFEVLRPEFNKDADYVLTTVELAKLFKQLNVDFINLPDTEFDNPLGESTGASAIFGRTGGVMEAALRTATDFITGKDFPQIEFKPIRGMETIKEAELDLAGQKIKVCVVHTLGEARKLMNQVKDGKCPYHFIEIMACYGGCVGGGGQPTPTNKLTLLKRTNALTIEDESKKIRKSHQNESVLRLYKEYIGEFGGQRAHHLLHTNYYKRETI